MKKSLRHFGVLGMHWGVHATLPDADSATIATIRAKRISDLSNSEIRILAERVKLEKHYNDITRSRTERGKAMVKTCLSRIALGAAIPLAAAGTIAIGKLIVKHAFGLSI